MHNQKFSTSFYPFASTNFTQCAELGTCFIRLIVMHLSSTNATMVFVNWFGYYVRIFPSSRSRWMPVKLVTSEAFRKSHQRQLVRLEALRWSHRRQLVLPEVIPESHRRQSLPSMKDLLVQFLMARKCTKINDTRPLCFPWRGIGINELQALHTLFITTHEKKKWEKPKEQNWHEQAVFWCSF